MPRAGPGRLTVDDVTKYTLCTEATMSAINVRDVPDDLHREAKIAALRGGKTFRDWIIEAVKEKLAREKDPK